MITRFTVEDFTEFMILVKDFNESLSMWEEQNSNNTWDMGIYIGEGKYYIEIELDESNNKSK